MAAARGSRGRSSYPGSCDRRRRCRWLGSPSVRTWAAEGKRGLGRHCRRDRLGVSACEEAARTQTSPQAGVGHPGRLLRGDAGSAGTHQRQPPGDSGQAGRESPGAAGRAWPAGRPHQCAGNRSRPCGRAREEVAVRATHRMPVRGCPQPQASSRAPARSFRFPGRPAAGRATFSGAIWPSSARLCAPCS